MDQVVIVFDGRLWIDKLSAHENISTILNFPSYYGKNLDALYDCLTTLNDQNYCLLILYPTVILDNLEEYGENLLETFKAASEANQYLSVKVKPY